MDRFRLQHGRRFDDDCMLALSATAIVVWCLLSSVSRSLLLIHRSLLTLVHTQVPIVSVDALHRMLTLTVCKSVKRDLEIPIREQKRPINIGMPSIAC